MASDILDKRREQAFPKLSARQIARLQAHGERVETRAGEVLAEPGVRHQKLLVVLSGSLEIVLPGMQGEEAVMLLPPGEFSGELSTLRGVAGFARVRVREGGAVLAIDEANLRDIVQADAELSEIFMRAFILRRVGLVASGQGEVMLLGSRHSAGTLRIREFLTRNAYPHVNVDLDGDPGRGGAARALPGRGGRHSGGHRKLRAGVQESEHPGHRQIPADESGDR